MKRTIIIFAIIHCILSSSCHDGNLDVYDLVQNNWRVCQIKNNKITRSGNSCLEISFSQNNIGKILVDQKTKDNFKWVIISNNVIQIDSAELINNEEYILTNTSTNLDKFTLVCKTCKFQYEMYCNKIDFGHN